MQHSNVLRQLVSKWVELQLKPPSDRGSFAPQKHALVERVRDNGVVPRDKRRRLCRDDKVPHLTVQEAVDSIYSN